MNQKNLLVDGHTKFVAQFLKQIMEMSTSEYPVYFNYQMTLIEFEKKQYLS